MEFKGLPMVRRFVVSARLEGFDSPWLHAKNHWRQPAVFSFIARHIDFKKIKNKIKSAKHIRKDVVTDMETKKLLNISVDPPIEIGGLPIGKDGQEISTEITVNDNGTELSFSFTVKNADGDTESAGTFRVREGKAKFDGRPIGSVP